MNTNTGVKSTRWAAKDLVGQKFGRLTVVKRLENGPNYKAMWECLCDCGQTKVTAGAYLRCQSVKSCGCLIKSRGGRFTCIPRAGTL